MYLADCLDSVLSQSLSDFEVVIVDDCSSDDTLRIAHSYALHDSRIRVFKNEDNLKLTQNWNRCVQLSRGQWIKFVFQDDLVLPDCLSRMLAAADEYKSPFISCGRDFIFEPATSKEDRQFYTDHQSLIRALYRDSPRLSAGEFSKAALQWIGRNPNLVGEPTAVLLHSDVFKRFGCFSPYLVVKGDVEYWVRVASHTGTVHIPEILAMFRVHAGSTTAHYKQTPARRYCVEAIEPLLMVHDFAFDPFYAALRAVATRCRPRVDLVDLFWSHALEALWLAKRAANAPETRDISLLEEWQKVAQHHRRLVSIPFRARLFSKWRALKRIVRPQKESRA
jgi:glycosyltransferase involved in cell wall biosynthesis